MEARLRMAMVAGTGCRFLKAEAVVIPASNADVAAYNFSNVRSNEHLFKIK